MKKKVLYLSSILLLLVIMFTLGLSSPVEASTTYGYGFASTPVSVYADASFSSTYISQLKEAINAWNSAGAGTLLTYAGTKSSVNLVGTGIMVTSIAQSGTTASTVTTVNGSNIVKAVISLNSNATFNNGSTSSGTYYLKSVFMHELGHALGLAENTTDSSDVMYYVYTGSTNITSNDVSDLKSIY